MLSDKKNTGSVFVQILGLGTSWLIFLYTVIPHLISGTITHNDYTHVTRTLHEKEQVGIPSNQVYAERYKSLLLVQIRL